MLKPPIRLVLTLSPRDYQKTNSSDVIVQPKAKVKKAVLPPSAPPEDEADENEIEAPAQAPVEKPKPKPKPKVAKPKVVAAVEDEGAGEEAAAAPVKKVSCYTDCRCSARCLRFCVTHVSP